MSLSAALSLLIPNALTVLTLLPILKALRDAYPDALSRRRAATAVGLSVIYGANIGGLGSVTATPANAILVAFIDMQALPGRQLHFAAWLAWGLPLTVVLSLAAIAVLWLTLGLSRVASRKLAFPTAPEPSLRRRQHLVLWLTVIYFAGATALSAGLLLIPSVAPWWLGLAAV
ncbi:MAG: anion permease, partial [Deltaproteobacteria bacterium]|nr:anion permease [Deltaproteobacteria bacterium]